MKYVPLLWSGIWRKPFSTLLTFLSICVAFLLFGLLHGVTTAMDGAIDKLAANRLNIIHAEMRAPLPIGYLSIIERVPGVKEVSAVSWVQGYFGDPKNWTNAAARSSVNGLSDSDEIELSHEYRAAFEKTRVGALVDRRLALKYGWKIGDLVPFTSNWRQKSGSNVWTFELVGVYDVPPNSFLADQLWFHFEYFDEARLLNKGTSDMFVVFTSDVNRNVEVAEAIDNRFENSSSPTTTTSERELARSGMEQAIDFSTLVKGVLGGSFFTLLLITATAMMESVRERTPELAVLKTLGFASSFILALVFAEALVLYATGGALGLAISKSLYPMIAPRTSGGGNTIPLPTSVIVQGALFSLLAAVLSGVAPALRAQRVSIVNALRRG
jgi:putative ABC transport system permease protein